jgi:hypothetical protein
MFKAALLKNRNKSFQRPGALLAILGVAIIGTILLISSHAASPYAASSATSGTVVAPATKQTCAGTSGTNNCVGFGAASNPGGSGTTSGGCTYNGTVAPCTNGSNSGTGASGWGTPNFDDEFNGTSLNTKNWSTGWFGTGITGDVGAISLTLGDCNDPKQLAVNNGELDITLIKQQETCTNRVCLSSCAYYTQAWPYTTGMITTYGPNGGEPPNDLFDFYSGFAEARLWLPAQPNGNVADWASWWLASPTDPNTGEIDLVEGLGGGPCWHIHYAGAANDGAGGCPSGTWTSGWHTYGVSYNKSSGNTTYYYDGQVVGSESGDAGMGPWLLVLSVGVNQDQTNPATMRVDYARVWCSNNNCSQ